MSGQDRVVERESPLGAQLPEQVCQGREDAARHRVEVGARQIREPARLADHEAAQPQDLRPDHEADVATRELPKRSKRRLIIPIEAAQSAEAWQRRVEKAVATLHQGAV